MKSTRSVVTLSVLSALLGGLIVALLAGTLGVGSRPPPSCSSLRGWCDRADRGRRHAERNHGGTMTAKEIYQRDAPGVVFITSEVVKKTESPLGFGDPNEQRGVTGSGFVIDKEGYLLTNAHVVDGAKKTTVQFSDKKRPTPRSSGATAPPTWPC